MARYIDADKAMEEVSLHSLCDWSTLGVKALIDKQPTADVVPRAEVERLQKALDAYEETSGLKKAKAEVAREIFAEIEKLSYRFMNDKHYIFGDMVWDIAELKKKWEGEE